MAEKTPGKHVRNCARAIIIRDGHILAVKYADEGGEYYALPGGGQLHGETLLETLVRECREELGVTVRSGGLRFVREYIGKDGESSWRDAHTHQVEFLYECELEPGEEPRFGQHADHTQVGIAWLAIDALNEKRLYPRRLADCLSRPLPNHVAYWGATE